MLILDVDLSMIKLAQALLPCDHAPVEISWIIFPSFKCFLLKTSMKDY